MALTSAALASPIWPDLSGRPPPPPTCPRPGAASQLADEYAAEREALLRARGEGVAWLVGRSSLRAAPGAGWLKVGELWRPERGASMRKAPVVLAARGPLPGAGASACSRLLSLPEPNPTPAPL